MSDAGDEDFKSLFDDDFDKTKGRKSAGLSDDSMVKNQQRYAASIKTLVDNTKIVNEKINDKVAIMVKDSLPDKCKITELTTLHVASRWYHILRYIKSNAQISQRFNLANFIDSDLQDIIVDNYNLTLDPDNDQELEYYEFPTLPLDTALTAVFQAVSDLQSFKACTRHLKSIDMFMDERKPGSSFKWTPASALTLYKKYYTRFNIMLQIIEAKFGSSFVQFVGVNSIARIFCNGYSSTPNPISKFLPYAEVSSYPAYKTANALTTINLAIMKWFRNAARIQPDVEYFTDLSDDIVFPGSNPASTNTVSAKEATTSGKTRVPATAVPTKAPAFVAATKPTAATTPTTQAAAAPGKKKNKQNMPCMRAFTQQECHFGDKCAYNHDTTNAELMEVANRMIAQGKFKSTT
jgi:hypothetical protein